VRQSAVFALAQRRGDLRVARGHVHRDRSSHRRTDRHCNRATQTPAVGTCVGNCHDSGIVTIADLITIVDTVLGELPVSACTVGDANGDGEITIDEIIIAVNSALSNCAMG